jgi:hypothetical protein
MFYRDVLELMDKFYPLSTITTTSRDPGFVTPEVKSLLRKKNRFLHHGQIEKADAVSRKISDAIVSYNSINFTRLDSRHGAKELWENVRAVTGKSKVQSVSDYAPGISAQSLNDHYALLSVDANYVASDLKCSVIPHSIYAGHITEYSVFQYLDKLKSSSPGTDGLPSWFLRVAAPCIAEPLCHIFNLSLLSGSVPVQWKSASITPLPKISQPTSCSDFRPISLTALPCRIFEKIILKDFIYPIFKSPSLHNLFGDQFAFRPTGSCEAALISILQHISDLLTTNAYVRLICLDFSKSFDTVRHSCVLAKLSTLPVDDYVYNWFVDYFKGHTHCTKFKGEFSSTASINASVFQGSVIGPSSFVINSTDLKPAVPGNFLDKYADDTFLVSPSSNDASIEDELANIEHWACDNNLSLNKSKSHEIVIFAKPARMTNSVNLAAVPSSRIKRVNKMKILGVTLQDNLSIHDHVAEVCASAAQSLYAIKLLKTRGLNQRSICDVFKATVLSRLTYASPAWWGFADSSDKQKLQSIVNRGIRWGYYDKDSPSLEQICDKRDIDLFKSILANPSHVLFASLPPVNNLTYNLRQRVHNRILPRKDSSLIEKNFIPRMLYCNAHCVKL